MQIPYQTALKMDKFRIGASYYPEWWTPQEWDEDFAKMQDIGFNVVRMGEFAWSWYEPREGEYNFEPMLNAVDCAQKHGIKVIMGTTTAVCPPWLYKKYPSVKGGNEKGHYDFGGRKGQCLSNEIFLDYAQKITTAQARALGSHENIIGWQLDNEPGFPFRDYDENCTEGFRKWLRKKYGTIEELNKAWFSMMFSNVYNSFDEICIPVNACEGGWQPEIQLDYRKYFSYTFNRLLKMEAETVRKYSPGRFIYTNWPGANWSVNCFEGSEYLDYAAWDNYVDQPYGDSYRVQLRASMEHSFDRRLSNGKHSFLVAEQKGLPNANGRGEVLRAQTWLNVSHGAFGTIFFEWRSPKGGPEQAYESVLGKDKNFREETEPTLRRLTRELEQHYSEIDGGRTVSDIGVLYSYENSWGTENWVVDGAYDEEFFNAYGGFKNRLRTNVDVIGIDDELSAYKIIVIPNHRITTEKQAEKIVAFVKNGGIAVLNTETGTREESNQMREMLEPGLFAEMCGARAVASISADRLSFETGKKTAVRYADGNTCEIHGNIHKLRLNGAQTVAVYTSGRLEKTPAVTINKFGKGFAVLYATDGNDVLFYEALAEFVGKQAAVKPLLDAGDGIIVSSRIKDETEYFFAVNMKDSAVKVKLSGKMFDVLAAKEISGEITVDGYDVLYLRNAE